eukprot:UN23722
MYDSGNYIKMGGVDTRYITNCDTAIADDGSTYTMNFNDQRFQLTIVEEMVSDTFSVDGDLGSD